MNPENYRGIALSCNMSKLFAAILNQRLLEYSLQNGIIQNNQLGFMPGNRTSDALVILYNLFQEYCLKNNKYIYACFVDFQKAFDSIPRHLLFEKLLGHNITGQFYNCIRNMYTKDLACICVDGKITESFHINKGVKQGCILSPLLFNIFLSDMPKFLGISQDSSPLNINQTETISSLLWADDLLMMSKTEQSLNDMLKNLDVYC